MGKLILCIEGLAAAWLAWRELYPDFYYLTDVMALLVLWAGVAVIAALALPWRSRKIFHNTTQRSIFVGVACAITLLIVFEVPMRVGFLTARAELSRLVEDRALREQLLVADTRIGLYTFSAEATNRRHGSRIDAGKHQVFFLAGSQGEAAFVHSSAGIEDLPYNRGSKGHLVGNWYWMKED